jgi:hypoxanthine phosphoribosyltransferase
MPDPRAAWEFLRDAECLVSAADVTLAIRRLAGEITARLSDAYPLVLTVMNGAVVFSGQLLPMLRFPLDVDYIHATRYGQATAGGKIEWQVPAPPGVRGRSVLVLDDILDGGHTMCAIRDQILAQGAEAFHCAVLVDKMLGRAKPIRADFVGLEIVDRFVFGCGMDAKGYWRNLPEIYAMKE